MTTTTNLGLTEPTVSGDDDAWGGELNADLVLIDNEWAVRTKGDTAYTIVDADRVIRLTTAFTTGRTFTLPAAANRKTSQPVLILDPVGAVSSTNNLTIAPGGSDTINGVAGNLTITGAKRVVFLWSDGVSNWIYAVVQPPNDVGISGGTGVFTGRLSTSQFLNVPNGSTLTIASGVATPSASHHFVDTEGSAASDDLDTLLTTNTQNGDILILQSFNSSRDVTVKNGTGNIICGSDRLLSHINDAILLRRLGSNWVMLSYSDNSP